MDSDSSNPGQLPYPYRTQTRGVLGRGRITCVNFHTPAAQLFRCRAARRRPSFIPSRAANSQQPTATGIQSLIEGEQNVPTNLSTGLSSKSGSTGLKHTQPQRFACDSDPLFTLEIEEDWLNDGSEDIDIQSCRAISGEKWDE
jgi:hypothetical protein